MSFNSVEIAPAQPELGKHVVQQTDADFLAQILQCGLAVSIVQRAVAALAVTPIKANGNIAGATELHDPAQELVPRHRTII